MAVMPSCRNANRSCSTSTVPAGERSRVPYTSITSCSASHHIIPHHIASHHIASTRTLCRASMKSSGTMPNRQPVAMPTILLQCDDITHHVTRHRTWQRRRRCVHGAATAVLGLGRGSAGQSCRQSPQSCCSVQDQARPTRCCQGPRPPTACCIDCVIALHHAAPSWR